MKYFYKELCAANPVQLSTGVPLNWELVANDTGVLATDDQPTIAELRVLIVKRQGGVLEIDEAKYTEKKSNPQFVSARRKTVIDGEYRIVDQNPQLKPKAPEPVPSVTAPATLSSPAAVVAVPPVQSAPEAVPAPKPAALPVRRPATRTSPKPVAAG